MTRITRRDFIRMGIGASAALLLVRNPYRLIQGARESDWEMPREGRISFVLGEVFLNDGPALQGDLVSLGDVIRTGQKSEAEVELRDYSIIHIKENTVIEVENILTTPALKIRKGWFLVIVRKGTPFEVFTPTVLAGVRGTVFFFYVYDDDTAYLCDCNGKIELSDVRTGELLRQISSQYHTAFDVKREGGTVAVEKTKMRYHEDDDILRMAGRFPRETQIFKRKKEGNGGY